MPANRGISALMLSQHFGKFARVAVGSSNLTFAGLSNEDDHGLETLIICPKNLVKMWNDYNHQYRLRATVLSISQVQSQFADMPRHRLARSDSRRTWANKFPG